MHSRPQPDPTFPPWLPRPDPVRTREALRDVRHAVHFGLGLARDTFNLVPLPGPAAAVTETVLRQVDRLAHQTEEAAETVVRGIFGGDDLLHVSLSEIETAPDADSRFAAAAYAALQRALIQLDAPELRVSEVVARDVYRRVRRDAPNGDDVALAAALTRGLLEARAIRGVLPIVRKDLGPKPAAVAPLSVFAVMLWLLCSRMPDEEALTASVSIASALANEICAASSDHVALGRLFVELKDRV